MHYSYGKPLFKEKSSESESYLADIATFFLDDYEIFLVIF